MPGSTGKKVALVIGRFQPLHNGHLEALKRILKENDSVLIVVGSAQEKRSDYNPLSFAERKRMLAKCFGEEGISGRVKIIPLRDYFDNEKWTAALLRKARGATAYYGNNELVRRLLRGKMEVHGMVSGIRVSATKIRELMKRDHGAWKKLVPKSVARFLEGKKLVKAFKENSHSLTPQRLRHRFPRK